ncbi:MAG: hypothetical protein L3J49_15285, partial [Desulfobulbaceae bacterium]|nr:hypothetical protein [Desulfobulbaceae bacterium]
AAMPPVQRIIGYRRILYFTLLLATLGFLVSPFVFDCIKTEYCTATNGLLDPLLKMAANMLPDLAAPWIKVLRNFPNFFYGLIVFFAILFVLKARLWAKTQWLATRAWAVLKK